MKRRRGRSTGANQGGEDMGKTRCEEWELRRLLRQIRSVLSFLVVPLSDCTMGIRLQGQLLFSLY
ncbi:unnamed protein product [Eruca vesicaria subsp. sativa]|uniref:Uncharacterized protein n=1 Tax=Eruca vesicaria subsp. sativa TaxID=29727 RepID=A0ABC8LSP8_ERUVS|nr:unnamed protein product [Eruca vesicaria subsp. sativa]